MQVENMGRGIFKVMFWMVLPILALNSSVHGVFKALVNTALITEV